MGSDALPASSLVPASDGFLCAFSLSPSFWGVWCGLSLMFRVREAPARCSFAFFFFFVLFEVRLFFFSRTVGLGLKGVLFLLTYGQDCSSGHRDCLCITAVVYFLDSNSTCFGIGLSNNCNQNTALSDDVSPVEPIQVSTRYHIIVRVLSLAQRTS